MGILSLLRGNNDAPKRAFVNRWLDTLELPEPQPPPPLPLPEAQRMPVWTLNPPTPLPAMRRFDNIAISQWQDPYATPVRMPNLVYSPHAAGLPFNASQGYKRVLVPWQESSDEEEDGDDETSARAGMIYHESSKLLI